MSTIDHLPSRAFVSHPDLPKASWLKVSWLPFHYSCALRVLSIRGANFYDVWIWRLNIVIRRPWLAGPARQLHPELFREESE